ncbi:MAG: hypothetical protein APF78_03800 [Sphingomonadales bacterium BRH_c3]|nr:MAG: hypothetical protein APF78_03800 [Sphingomonadales bacterium BRH_c3]
MKMLPDDFADLEAFAKIWALSTESDRFMKVSDSTLDEMRPFYDTTLPRLAEMSDYLQGRGHPYDWAYEDKNLLNLILALFEVYSPLFIHQKPGGSPLAVEAERLEVLTPCLWQMQLPKFSSKEGSES